MTMQWSVKILALYTYLPSYVGDRTHKRRAKQAERACSYQLPPQSLEHRCRSDGPTLGNSRSKMSKANNGDERHISTNMTSFMIEIAGKIYVKLEIFSFNLTKFEPF